MGVLLFGCFLGAGLIAFIIQKNQPFAPEDQTKKHIGQNEFRESAAQHQHPMTPNTPTSISEQNIPSDDIEDLEALLGDMVDDVSDAIELVWSSREISSDFSDYNEVEAVIGQFPIVSKMNVKTEQLDQLRDNITTTLYYGAIDDFDSLARFLKESGEKPAAFQNAADPWQSYLEEVKHEKNEYGFRSRWKGLVLEGSKIKVFETQTSDPPMLGNEIYDFCGAVCTFDHRTLPPISLEELLKEEGKALMADMLVFIQHDDEMGGVVWPYVFRYFFDPINNKWRVKRQIQYSNKNKPSPGGLFLH